MPELPEVEFCGRSLSRWTTGRRIVGVDVVDTRSVRTSRTSRPTAGHPSGADAIRRIVIDATPGTPLRHGKRLLWPFRDGALLLHLGMTGKWTRVPTKFPKVRLILDTGDALTFSDPRLLGGIVPTTIADGRRMLIDGLGPDALNDGMPMLRGGRAVKVAMMDQSAVAGLGNLHVAEALWRAGVDPTRACDAVSTGEWRRIAAAVAEQLAFALAMTEGEDEIVYVEDAGGPNPFPVYQRDGEPCPRCARTIERIIQAGRSTYWCPGCQR